MFGLLCFSVYCLAKGYSARETGSMLWEGIFPGTEYPYYFVFIGGLTAVWRISGTIPYILYYAVGSIHPRYFVLCTFLLCSSMSFLTGTSFGTASTMGVICMLISNAAGLSPFLTGGAILSGSFFGDRCSPMSSSAQLICSLTRTDIYLNIKLMCRSSAVPLASNDASSMWSWLPVPALRRTGSSWTCSGQISPSTGPPCFRLS
ncbi:MAG: Na+/H+ antiporter NhaC family protein [Enterocloster sp.]